MKQHMRFIQIGVGGFGRTWVDVLAAERRARVVGLVDTDREALRKALEKTGCGESACFTSLERCLEAVEADALVCVTPPALHRRHVVAGLYAGLHVISEKPMADRMADCRAMLNAAKKSGRMYVVSQNYRYRPAMYTIAELVRKGAIGEIGQVSIDFFMGVGFRGFRARMDYPLLVDMAIHHFDLIRFVTGLEPVSVRGEAWNPFWSHYAGESSSSLVFEMSSGARVLYNGSWSAKGSYCDWNGNWLIEGGQGAIEYRSGNIVLHDVPDGYETKRRKTIKPRSMRRQDQAFVLDDFIRYVQSGNRPGTDADDNVSSMAMVFAAVRAVDTGRRVRIG